LSVRIVFFNNLIAKVTSLFLGRDRALVSALLGQVAHAVSPSKSTDTDSQHHIPDPLVMQLDEGDCGNTTSALRALIGGFTAQFEQTDAEVRVTWSIRSQRSQFYPTTGTRQKESEHNFSTIRHGATRC
jgi:hypothetical protein